MKNNMGSMFDDGFDSHRKLVRGKYHSMEQLEVLSVDFRYLSDDTGLIENRPNEEKYCCVKLGYRFEDKNQVIISFEAAKEGVNYSLGFTKKRKVIFVCENDFPRKVIDLERRVVLFKFPKMKKVINL